MHRDYNNDGLCTVLIEIDSTDYQGVRQWFIIAIINKWGNVGESGVKWGKCMPHTPNFPHI